MSSFYPAARAVLSVVFDSFEGPDEDPDPVVFSVLPKSVTVHKNAYKQADAWEIVCDGNDFPFDPDLIRAGGIEIYLFQTAGQQVDPRVIGRQDPTIADPTGLRPRDPIDALKLDLSLPDARQAFTFGNKPIVAGAFDEHDLEMSNDGKWVTISGQDYTAHLAGMQWPPTESGRARKIPVGRRVDVILADILAEADPDSKLRLDVRGLNAADLPIVGASETTSTRRGIPVQQDTTYWDVMYKLATRHGLIIFVDGLDVVLSRPQNLDAQNLDRVLQMAWGKNIASLRLSRHLGKEQVPTIVVQGYDPKTHRTISVEYPEGSRTLTAKTVKADVRKTHMVERIKAKKTAHSKHHGKKTATVRRKDEYEIVPLYGVTDPVLLRRAAQNMYHVLGRAERKVILQTKDLKDLEETSILQLRSGSAVSVGFEDYNRELISNPNVPEASKMQHLLARGYSRVVAEQLARRYVQLQGLRRPLRVREVTYDYSVDDGISVEMELVDFVLVDGSRDGVDKLTRLETREAKLTRADGSRVGLGDRALEAARVKQGADR